MMKCEECGVLTDGNILVHQDFYITDRVEDNLEVEAKNYKFCSRDCLNNWKWKKYYNYLEIDTERGEIIS